MFSLIDQSYPLFIPIVVLFYLKQLSRFSNINSTSEGLEVAAVAQ